jgi:hypothetical protein
MDASWTSQLVGRIVDAVERREGGACVVALAGGYCVQIESLWRLLSSGTLALTSQDEGQLFGRNEPVQAIQELSSKLQGHTLTAIQVAPGTADLTLQFGGYSLQAVADSSGYEAWQVNGPGGIVAVGQGGGNVAVWGGAA